MYHLHQIWVRDLLLEEQPGHVGPQDHVQADGLGEQASADGRQQHKGEALATR